MTPKQLYIIRVLQSDPGSPQDPWRRRRVSKQLAAHLYDRGIPLAIVQNAMLLVIARRILRPADALPLPPIRTLYYFLPEIEEFLAHPPDPEYIHYLRYKLHRLT